VETTPVGTSEERQLAMLIANAIDYAIFVMDTDGVVRTWNAGAERMNGYTREEIVGRHFSTFYTPEDVARDHPGEELRLALRDGRYEEEGWRVRKDGSRFCAKVVINALRDEDGKLVGFVKVSRDLSARREHEVQLDEFRRLVSGVRDYAIFMLDPDGNILTWNAGAEHLKGYAPEEIIGRHFSTFYTQPDRDRDHPAHELEVAIREGRYEEEGWRVRKDGTTFWASVTITAIHNDDGRLAGFAKVTRDLTERKLAEDALQAAIEDLRRANEELDRFASVAAHDMTDPLRTISGFAEILLESPLTPEEVSEYTQHILDSSLRMSAMLDGLLTYARAGRPAAIGESVGVAEVAAQVEADLAHLIARRDARLEMAVPPQASVLADPDDLRLILQNLISNALKFGDLEAPVVELAARPAGDGGWEISVEDNGSGIAEQDRERIFNAFQRAQTGHGEVGYGLGLAICNRLVVRHGGALECVSEPGHGARFSFKLSGSDPSP
jgi:PAS domain S-box-containing protein